MHTTVTHETHAAPRVIVLLRKPRGKLKKKKKKANMEGIKKSNVSEFSLWLTRLRTQLVSIRIPVQSLASLSGLRIRHFCGCGIGWQL